MTVADSDGRVVAGCLEQALGLLDRQRLGQEPLRARQVEVGGHVHADEPFAVREAIEALERGGPSTQAARGEPRVAPPAPTRPRREVVDGGVGRGGPCSADVARRGEVVQVAPIRADRRRSQAAFDMQVGQVGDRSRHRGRPRWRPVSAGPGDPAAPGLRAVEELAGAGQRRGTTGLAAEHLGELDDPALAIEVLDLGHRATVTLALDDPVLGVGVGRDLGQMGHAQDLVAPREGPQAAPDRVRAPTADPRVDLVEDEDRRVVGLGQDALDRQRHARQLATRRDPGQRPGRLARVRGETIDDLVDAARIERDRVAVELDRRLVPSGHPPAEPDLEDAGREAKVAQDVTDRGGQRGAGRGPGGRKGRRRGSDLVEQRRILALAPGTLRVETAQPLELGRRSLAMGDDGRLAVAIAAFEGVDRAEPLLERGQGDRIVLDRIGQAADLERDVVELRLEPGQPLGQRLETRVEAGQTARLADRLRRRVAGARAVGGQRLPDRGRSPGDRLAMLGGRQPGADLVGLADSQPCRRDLGRLVLEQVDPAGELARVDRQLRERGAVGAPAFDACRPSRARVAP